MKKITLILAILVISVTSFSQQYTKPIDDTTFVVTDANWYFSGQKGRADYGFHKDIYDSTITVKAMVVVPILFNDKAFEKTEFKVWTFNRSDTLWKYNRFGEKVNNMPLEVYYDTPTDIRIERLFDRLSDGWR